MIVKLISDNSAAGRGLSGGRGLGGRTLVVKWTGEEVDTLDLHSFVRTFAEDPRDRDHQDGTQEMVRQSQYEVLPAQSHCDCESYFR